MCSWALFLLAPLSSAELLLLTLQLPLLPIVAISLLIEARVALQWHPPELGAPMVNPFPVVP